MKILVPNNVTLELSPMENVAFQLYNPKEAIPPEHHDAEALVFWGNPPAKLKEAARALHNLRWIQSLSAGPNDILEAGFDERVVITSGRGLHDITVAEHTIALLLCAARRLHEMRDAQAKRRWSGHLGGKQPVRPKGEFRSLDGANILIWGFGSIAARLAPLLLAFGANVQGVASTSGVRHGFQVSTVEDINGLLPSTDALVMILPSVPKTQNALDASRLALLPRHAWVVNVGRGETVDVDALVDALSSGRLAGAALDVFSTEPLPTESPLWDLTNVIISPHAAGGRPIGAAALIQRNLANLQAGRPLENEVDRQRGY
jgi:phosphoglycerate dehydrogenase-like enzyme